MRQSWRKGQNLVAFLNWQGALDSSGLSPWACHFIVMGHSHGMFFVPLLLDEDTFQHVAKPPVTKPKKSPGLRKSGLCYKKEDGLHTPPAGNIFFCVVIIGEKTE